MTRARARSLRSAFCVFALASLGARAAAQVPLFALEDAPGAAQARFGERVAAAGDLDGDGLGDVLVAAPGLPLYGVPFRGRVRAVSGADGAKLFEVRGRVERDRFGIALAALGDVDGDGRSDFAVGAPLDALEPGPRGRVTVHSGANGAVLFAIEAKPDFEEPGDLVLATGDTDGDGTPDLLVGSRTRLRVISGRGDGRVLLDLVRPFQVTVTSDRDGDGVRDLVLGRPIEGEGGRLSIVSGATGRELASFAGTADEPVGGRFAAVDDLDGDGQDDLLEVGSQGYWNVTARSLADFSILHEIPGGPRRLNLGWRMGGLGDQDGDGVPDFWLLAEQGHALLRPSAPLAGVALSVDIVSGADGSVLTTISFVTEADANLPWLARAGDTNGDGIEDLALGVARLPETAADPTPVGGMAVFAGGTVSDPCHLLVEDFESGALPDGWSASGLWHVTQACPQACADGSFVYYGVDATCDYDVGHTAGELVLPEVRLARLGRWEGLWLLDVCLFSLIEPHYDILDLVVEEDGAELLRANVHPGSRQAVSRPPFDLTRFAGGAVSLRFDFDTQDEINNALIGVQIDDLELAWTAASARFGRGRAGSGGLVPALALEGCPYAGSTVVLRLTGALGGASATLLVGGAGTSPRDYGRETVLVRPTSLPAPIALAGSGAGAGHAEIPWALSESSGGERLRFQALVRDPAAPGGFAVSNAVEILVRP